ncbi:hypothetical protein RJ639_015755 [Escallonia herrerae]|uniref:Disease resistance N-terminal domain-containing protein n=1 Tax=Escallonia herrerae TaxID=1293975 RepID=A0AA88VED4_9ASTE|nr:hypothetical protein RJ639_015755 [Escallonia herrerae]
MADVALAAALVLAEEAVKGFRREELYSTKNVQKVVSEIDGDLEEMQAYLRDMEGKNLNEVMKQEVIQVRDVAYDVEDVLDEFMLHGNHRIHKVTKAAYRFAHYVRDNYIRDISSKVQHIKKKRLKSLKVSLFVPTQGSPSTPLRSEQQLVHTLDDDEIVGCQTIRVELLHQLTHGELRRTTISLVGQGGSGSWCSLKMPAETLGRALVLHLLLIFQKNCRSEKLQYCSFKQLICWGYPRFLVDVAAAC